MSPRAVTPVVPIGGTRPLTKIIATIGPASCSRRSIERLVLAGVSIFRINFSHGKQSDYAKWVKTIRAVGATLGQPVAILGDLPGPKLRIGPLSSTAGGSASDGVDLVNGSIIVFRRDHARNASTKSRSDEHELTCTYTQLIDDAAPGHRLLINDGAVRTLVIEKSQDELRCVVTHGGRVTTGKGINLPDSTLTVGAVTEADRRHAAWAIEHDLDFLALSFVRHGDDVRVLEGVIGQIAQERGEPDLCMPIVAKIERPQAVDAIDSILDVADAIMVARGDLGVELELARVPVVQKKLIARAHDHGRPCIVATQMLESMINAPSPTRAEASDVAGAIFERVDAVMLSGETAVGRYPVVAVEYMCSIADHAEQATAETRTGPTPPALLKERGLHAAGLAHGVWTVAEDIQARLIVVWSQAGGVARFLSQNGMPFPILAITSDERAARQMQLLRAVTPLAMECPADLAALTEVVDRHLQDAGWALAGDACILVGGEPPGMERVTNRLAIHVVGDATRGFARPQAVATSSLAP